jgi:hypothetical protein
MRAFCGVLSSNSKIIAEGTPLGWRNNVVRLLNRRALCCSYRWPALKTGAKIGPI